MKDYDPTKWFWRVGGDQTKVYSSALGDYVPSTDATFQAWTADGSAPSNIDTEANLGGVLAPYYPTTTRPAPAGILDAYQQNQADDVFQHKLVKFMFMLLNRVQVLEGKQPFTVAQARAYVKGLM